MQDLMPRVHNVAHEPVKIAIRVGLHHPLPEVRLGGHT
jgi:hypothetical protein